MPVIFEYPSFHMFIKYIPDETVVNPSHVYNSFTTSTIKKEKVLNANLGNAKAKQELTEFMDNLNLVKSKHIDVAVPGNIASGLG